MGLFDSSRERDARDKEEVAGKKGVDASDLRGCPDCNGGYNGLFKCRTCDGDGQIEK